MPRYPHDRIGEKRKKIRSKLPKFKDRLRMCFGVVEKSLDARFPCTVRSLTDEEALAKGYERIDPPESGTYGTYRWRDGNLKFPDVLWDVKGHLE